jgi:S1-C subfamily serine protease
MDIEHLNKSQIVLLTLLVSFVTSIATGIVTVSLMEQAPPVIPQTINRVVERTVERVVPHETQTATVITTEKTVVVKETDLISQAVARTRPSVIRLYTKGLDGAMGDFASRGFVVGDTYVIAAIVETVPGNVYLVPAGDKHVEAKVVKVDAEKNLALLSLAEPDGVHTPAATLGTGGVTLGQTLIAITGSASVKVASGIVTAVNEAKGEGGETLQTSFETNMDALTLGSPLLNTDGAVIGMFVGSDEVVPSSALAALVRSIKPADVSSATSTKSN